MGNPQRTAGQGNRGSGDAQATAEPAAVRIRMLGGFSVSVGSRSIEEGKWRLKKAANLVKLLALEPGHQLQRERVLGLLWPDLEAEAAANALIHTLDVARTALEPAPPATSSCYLHLLDDHLVLCPDSPLWVDAEAFAEAAVAARRSGKLEAYRAAVGLYAGDLLPGDVYEKCAEDRREELRGTYLTLLVELAGLHEEREEHGLAIEALERAVATEPVYEEAHAGLMRLYALSGRQRKALKQYERLLEALSEEEPEPEPGAEVWRLYMEISTGRFSQARLSEEHTDTSVARQHNLPAARTSFIGRERELDEVKGLLAATRLLTLTGAGGGGKTRLALAAASDLVRAYPEGVWLVELAPLLEGALVPQAVADALSVREQPGRPLDATLVDALRHKKMLLVLDNCEHLVEASARLVETLLDSCPELQILATSREALDVAGETNWRVPSLSLPDPGRPPTIEELERYESTRLFVERARQRSSTFVLTPENAGAVAQISRKLDGLPLVIELAAARVGALAVEQISERLGDSLALLTSGARTAASKQQTLRGALDWSYDLLSEPEKRLFGRLSVFAGGWTLETAETVGAERGAGDGIEREDVLELLSKLVDKSLVVAEASSGTRGALRYRLLEPVRQYGRERLQENGETEAARRRHAELFLALAEEAEPELVGVEQAGWLERLETEHDNLRAALGWFLEQGEAEPGQRLAGDLGEFWRVRGHLGEGLRWLEEALANGDASPTLTRVKALVHAAYIAWERMDFERSKRFSAEALKLSRKLGDKAGTASALYHLGMVAVYDQMRAEEAWGHFEEAVALRRELEDKTGTGRALQKMGLISVVRRDFERAAVLFEESLMLARETGDKLGIAFALWLGALVALGRGDYQRVKVLCGEGLDLARQLRHTHAIVLMLHVLAASAGSRGQAVRSARLWGAAESLLDTLGLALGPAERYHYSSYISAARASLVEEATWEVAWARGRTMTSEAAIEYALSEEEATSTPDLEEAPASRPTRGLTRREKEVATLIERGLSNRRIAEELSISERTVDNHVANILKKLNLTSRHQAAAWLKQHSLDKAD